MELAANAPLVKPDHAFRDWFDVLQDLVGARVDKMAARYLWERGYGVREAMVKIVVG